MGGPYVTQKLLIFDYILGNFWLKWVVFSLLPTKNGCFSVIIDLSNAKLLNMRQFDKFFQKQNQNAQNIHGRLTPHFAPLCAIFLKTP